MASLGPIEKMKKLGELHMMHHRNGDAGEYTVKIVDDKHMTFIENTLWPDDMIYGYIYGAAQRFLRQRRHRLYRLL